MVTPESDIGTWTFVPLSIVMERAVPSGLNRQETRAWADDRHRAVHLQVAA